MDRIFFEEEDNEVLRVAAYDTQRVFQAENPGHLASVFECSLKDLTMQDNAQIFYAMAPSIGADDIFADLKSPYRSCKLNSWNITIKDKDVNNLFQAVEPMKHEDRVLLYSNRHSITPTETIISDSASLMSLVAFSQAQQWKTGILQRCIDALVLPNYRCKAEVYAIIDEEYRRLMRFKYETEFPGTPKFPNGVLIDFIRRIVSILGLKNSRDTTTFKEIPDVIDEYLEFFKKVIPFHDIKAPRKERLSSIFTLWCGSKIVTSEGGFQLEIDSCVTQGLSYMSQLLEKPKKLAILEDSF